MRRWQPRALGLWIEPGIAKTSRPASAASRAVIRAPERWAASTTRASLNDVSRVTSPLIDPEDATWVKQDDRGFIQAIGKTIPHYDTVDCGAFLATPELAGAIGRASGDRRLSDLGLAVAGLTEPQRQRHRDRAEHDGAQVGGAEQRRAQPDEVDVGQAEVGDRAHDPADRTLSGRRAGAMHTGNLGQIGPDSEDDGDRGQDRDEQHGHSQVTKTDRDQR